jgi:hypothetical protein
MVTSIASIPYSTARGHTLQLPQRRISSSIQRQNCRLNRVVVASRLLESLAGIAFWKMQGRCTALACDSTLRNLSQSGEAIVVGRGLFSHPSRTRPVHNSALLPRSRRNQSISTKRSSLLLHALYPSVISTSHDSTALWIAPPSPIAQFRTLILTSQAHFSCSPLLVATHMSCDELHHQPPHALNSGLGLSRNRSVKLPIQNLGKFLAALPCGLVGTISLEALLAPASPFLFPASHVPD